jgi:hypothetical protein
MLSAVSLQYPRHNKKRKCRAQSQQQENDHNPKHQNLAFIFRFGRGNPHHVMKQPHGLKQRLHNSVLAICLDSQSFSISDFVFGFDFDFVLEFAFQPHFLRGSVLPYY